MLGDISNCAFERDYYYIIMIGQDKALIIYHQCILPEQMMRLLLSIITVSHLVDEGPTVYNHCFSSGRRMRLVLSIITPFHLARR